MQDRVYEMIETLLELSAFELEYRHRANTNPFMDKWIHCTKTKFRSKKLRDFLYDNLITFLNSDLKEEFYKNTLRNYIRVKLEYLLENIEKSRASDEIDILYRYIYYRLSLDELFILLTNLITWEHIKYPLLLENAVICDVHEEKLQRLQTPDILHYYIRFLDVLSSTAIISLFDLDALKHTIESDRERISKTPLKSLNLYRDWPPVNDDSFETRFPDFKVKLQKHLEIIPNCV